MCLMFVELIRAYQHKLTELDRVNANGIRTNSRL